MDTCKPEWSERLSSWFDDEVDGADRRAVEAHLGSCLVCRRVAAEWKALRGRMRTRGVPAAPVRTRFGWRKVMAIAAVLALVVAAGLSLRSPKSTLMDQLEQHHFQAFARTSPCEFQSSDPAAVGAWLQQKVGYAVEVPKVPGATLLGARRCKLDGVLSASLLFRRGDAAVTVFVPPHDAALAPMFAKLTSGGGRCVMGRLGERVCSSRTADALAVANADPATVVAFADATAR